MNHPSIWIASITFASLFFACHSNDTETPLRRLEMTVSGDVEVSPEVKGLWSQDLIEGLKLTEGPNAQWRFRIVIDSDDAEISEQGAVIQSDGAGQHTIHAKTPTGASNGLYSVLMRYGIVYGHPRETFIPNAEPSPLTLTRERIEPDFLWRGFHEHTQHPIPMSVFGLEAGAQNLENAKAYIRWLARNRQNVLTFHFLNTVDQATWAPHMAQLVDYAHLFGVKVGVVVGFVDQQQNAFRLVRPSETNEPENDQIIRRLTPILDTGLDWIGFQIGSSEFTKPDDQQVLGWLNHTVAFLANAYPQVKPFAWIHITCGLYGDNGESFFHLPLQADERLASFVHTTMFYTLSDPAPVYDCEDFTHQLDYFEQGHNNRELIYFPETAWWLGFDNNVPLATPIVGPSRFQDITKIKNDFSVTGHVTFTTGREWTYWMYDHYLTRVTWDSRLDWSSYLSSIAPIYGRASSQSLTLLNEWTERQLTDLYETNPEIYFYLSGELPQDEVGERVGITARRPKRSFHSILDLDEASYEKWQREDLALLDEIAEVSEAMVDELPLPGASDTNWYHELFTTYQISALRAQHALSLYSAVKAVRNNDEANALEHLNKARLQTSLARAFITQQERRYRYGPDILTERRNSLTTYPYGYLHETSTGYFWTRRDDQLAQYINTYFHPPPESWGDAQGNTYAASSDGLTVVTPNNPLIGTLLQGLMPALLFRIDTIAFNCWLGVDQNENGVPDSGSLERFTLTNASSELAGRLNPFSINVVDDGGQNLGILNVFEADFTFNLETESVVNLTGNIDPNNLAGIVTGFGIEVDATKELIKNVWGFDRNEALPLMLPIELNLTLVEVSE